MIKDKAEKNKSNPPLCTTDGLSLTFVTSTVSHLWFCLWMFSFTPFSFSWSSLRYPIPLLEPLSYSVLHFSQLFAYCSTLFPKMLFIFTPPKSRLPQPNSALQQSKWGWNCCVYSSEFVKIRMWRFHTIYWKYIGHIERSRKDWQLKLILTLHAIFLVFLHQQCFS